MSNNKRTVESDAATLSFGEEFKDAHALLNAEVALLLDVYEKSRKADPSLPYAGPNPLLLKVRQHLDSCCPSLRNRELIRELRASAIGTLGLAEFEMAQVGNLVPEGVEEAKCLIPSLSGRISEEGLQKLLDDVAVMKRLG